MTKRKVLVDIHYLLVAKTGIKTYIDDLIRVFGASTNNQIDYVFVPAVDKVNSTDYFRKGGFFRSMVFHLHTFWWKSVGIHKHIRRTKADIAIFPDYVGCIGNSRAKKIIVFHDAFFWKNPGHYNRIWWLYFDRLMAHGLRGDSKILTVSEHSKRQIEVLAKPNQDVEFIHSIGPKAKKNTTTKALPQTLTPQKYFLHVGVMEKRKNIPTIIKAFKQLKQDVTCADYKLVLVGSQGPKKKLDDSFRIEQMILDLDLEDQVVLTGYINKEVLESIYSQAYCYLFPSQSEGFGYPVLEAFSYGVPVITSRDGALTEVGGAAVSTADTMDPVDWSNKMKEVISNEERCVQMRELGYARLRAFSEDQFLSKYEQIILA